MNIDKFVVQNIDPIKLQEFKNKHENHNRTSLSKRKIAMKVEEALKIQKFVIDWITKVVSRKKSYQVKLIEAVKDLIPDDIREFDPYGILQISNWDRGNGGMGARLVDLLDWQNIYCFTKKANEDLSCAIRIAIDLFIEQSGGVVGYTIGDLRKVFDEDQLLKLGFKKSILKAKDSSPIWL